MVNERPALMTDIFAAYDDGRILDTFIRQKLRKIAQGNFKFDSTTGSVPAYHLSSLVKEFFAESIEGKYGPDAWRFRYHELDQVPVSQWPEAARQYSYLDADYTMRVWRKFLDLENFEVEGAGKFDLEAQCRHGWWMHLMEAWGIRTDPVAVNALEVEVQATVDAAMPKLVEAGIFNKKGKKSNKLLQVLTQAAYEAKGEPVQRTPKGGVKISKEVLLEANDAQLTDAAEIASEKSILTGAIPLLRKAQILPFNPKWNVIVATGRTSCGGEEDPGNLQNQRRRGGVRECWWPRAGWVFVDADYSIAELCSLSQILLDKYGTSNMAEAMIAGRELHLDMAATILNISYEECEARYKAGDPEVEDARQLAKAASFGYPGGLGKYKFQQYAKDTWGVILTLEEADNIKKMWLAKFPEMKTYFRDIGRAVAFGPARMVQHRSNRIRGGVLYSEMANSYFQGLTADGAKAAGYEIARECYAVPSSPLYGCRIVAFVHDEYILEAPIHKARGAATRLSEIMVEQMRRFTPDIPAKAEACLMRRWYKGAKAVADAQGRLIPWEPPHPGKAFVKACKGKGLTPEAFADLAGLPGSEAALVAQGKASLHGSWYGKLAEVFGGKAEDWKTAQHKWDLEQRAKQREAALGLADYWQQ